MGEGWGEGEYSVISRPYVPLPLIPSHPGRGNSTFYESINTWSASFFGQSTSMRKLILQLLYRQPFDTFPLHVNSFFRASLLY